MPSPQERTEEATPRRLEKAREDGRILSSKYLLISAHFLIGYFYLTQDAERIPALLHGWKSWMELAFDSHAGLSSLLIPYESWFRSVAAYFLVAALVASLGTLAIHLSLTRGYFSLARLQPNPGRSFGFSRIKGQLQDGIKNAQAALLILALFSLACWFLAAPILLEHAALMRYAIESQFQGQLAKWAAAARWGAAFLCLYGLIDFVREKRRYDAELRMTKHEIKEEFKEGNGNPEVKAKIRRLMKSFGGKRMMQQVPKANVVITNPTHYAIAIHFVPGETSVPIVLAKGVDHLALRIRKIATQNQIPIVENPPLAQALYKSVEVGQEIPMHLYRAVAEVLAYVYRILDRSWKP
jgi:flagellar biosynthesis protein FlhB